MTRKIIKYRKRDPLTHIRRLIESTRRAMIAECRHGDPERHRQLRIEWEQFIETRRQIILKRWEAEDGE